MDKRTIHAVPARLAFRCYCLDAAGKCAEPLPSCTPHVIVNPQALEAVESLAAKVPDLERENATLKAVCGKKDEALDMAKCVLLETCEECTDERFHGNACHEDATCSIWAEINAIEQALSLSPSSAAEYAANARVGKAVTEWANRGFVVMGDGIDPVQGVIAFDRCLTELREVIAKAREVAPHGN